ncbi:hypothetical protein [Xanthomonas oryzae]|uniref:Uncharacterized protein n=1 Tax=Xanthomonas oryzae pv. oryzae (strain PXO99A) TaxID=360094 RepID=A0A0J9WX41_XANOP|nr:hypothetical protein [Xanthomonas oryzae]ACD59215.1 hypothetical protein PXO_00946 [Xanthomonas oryzae pv. oryzae PXO99A]ACD59408.1 hypothetical protein PXO_06220 [Xanthomonas oryzae pv. oryzae PXO99A]
MVVRILVGVVALAAIGVGLLLLRNDQMDRGVRALKEENGAAALERLKPLLISTIFQHSRSQ